MDNNFNNPNGQPMGGMSPDDQPTVYLDPNANGQNMLPDDEPTVFLDPNQVNQAGNTQPGAAPQGGFVQPGVAPQGNFAQPGMAPQGNFVQPGMAPQGNFAQPGVAPQPPANGGKPPKVKKPMSGGKLAGIIGAGVALVALIVCGIIFIPKLFKPAKDVVVDAFENSFSAEKNSDESYEEKVLGMSDISDALMEKGGTVNMDFNISEVAGQTLNMGFSMDEAYDPVNKLVNVVMLLTCGNSDLMEFTMIGDETNTYFMWNDAINGYFSLPNDNMLGALESSPLGEAMEFEMTGVPETDVDYFANPSEEAPAVNSDYVDAIEGLWDKVTVEKQGKVKVDVNGTAVQAKEYYVTFAEADIEDAISSAIDGLTEDMLSDTATLEAAGMDATTMSTYMNQIKAMVETLIDGDLIIKVYVKDDKVVKVAAEDSLSLYGVSLDYDFHLDVDDVDVAGAFTMTVMEETVGITFEIQDYATAPTGKFAVNAAGEEIAFVFDTAVTESGDSTNTVFNGSLVYGSEKYFEMGVTSIFNEASNTFEVFGDVTIVDAGTISFSTKGSISNISKGVSFVVNIDSLQCSVDGEVMFKANGRYAIDTSSVSASGIDSSLPVYDITVLTETDFEDIILENEDSINAWIENINNNQELNDIFGASFDDYDDMSDESFEEEVYEEEDVASSSDAAAENVIESSYAKVKILGTIDGFDLDSSSAYYIGYYTPEYSTIYYSLIDASAEDILAGFTGPDDGSEIYAENYNAVISVDGEDVSYSVVQYDNYGYLYSEYIFVKPISDTTCLVVEAGIYDEDDSYTAEQVAQAISSQFYEVLQ